MVLFALAGCPAEPDDGEPMDANTDAETESTGATLDCSECDGDPACHSHVDANAECTCDPGYEWANPDDLEDYACAPVESESST